MDVKYQNLWKKLPTDVEANLAFARFVIDGEFIHTKYFFGDYSLPIIKWIILTLYTPKNNSDVRELLYQFTGDYYEFVAGPFNDYNRKPQWYQLVSYRGENGLKLKSWLQSNGYQYFSKRKAKSEKIAFSEKEMIEFVDYEALIHLEDGNIELSDTDVLYRERLKRAWNDLPERDQCILQLLVIEKNHWEDAYDELKHFINPRGGKEVMETWSDKRKQDALSLLKARAIEHLIKRFNVFKN